MDYVSRLVSDLSNFGLRPELVKPGDDNLGSDLAMPCFALAKEQGRNPQEIAQEIAKKLEQPDIARAEAVAGYLNLWLKPSAFAAYLNQNKAFGTWPSCEKTAIIEIGSLNMSKPFSVGHLRPTFHGAALANLYRNLGYKVVTDNHIGDWGTPFGKWVVGVKRYSSDQEVADKGIYELARVYVLITEDEKKLTGSELDDLKLEVQSWLQRLADGDAEAVAYHQRFLSLSLDHMHDVMNRMGVSTDLELGESTYVKRGMEIVDELVAAGKAEAQDDGSVVVDLSQKNIDVPLLVKKSDGNALYATSDLATAEYRQQNYNPDLVVIPTDEAQKFYFEQLNAALEITGIGGQIRHYWFGQIKQQNQDGTVSKMSSRKGVVLMEDLLDKAEAQAADLNPNASSSDLAAVAVGALKFADLSQDPKSDVIFDWGSMYSLSGYCGPYVQYATVRVKAIIEKSGVSPQYDPNYSYQDESSLLSAMLRYEQVTKDAALQFAPHKIAVYVYDLAKTLNAYYENNRVIGSQNQETRLWLLDRVRQNLVHGLSLLGIEAPDRM